MNPVLALNQFIHDIFIRKKFQRSVIHNGATADAHSKLGEYAVLFRDASLINSTLGAYSYLQSGSVACNAEIGKFCSIASNVSIGLVNHPIHMVSTSPVFYDHFQPLPRFFVNKKIYSSTLLQTTIGSDVWIGQGAMILAGVNIGVGAVIGAGAVVTKDVEPYVIAAGNPCRIIRRRFSETVIKQLITSKWWELPESDLKKLALFFVDPDIFLNSFVR